MSECDSCKQYCMKNSEVSVDSCMQTKCPECVSSGNNGVCQNQKTFDQGVRKALKYVIKENRLSTFSMFVIFLIMVAIIVWALCLASKVSDKKIMHNLLALLTAPFYIIAYYLNKEQK